MNQESVKVRPRKSLFIVAIIFAIFAGLVGSLFINLVQSRSAQEIRILQGEEAISASALEKLVKKKNLEIYWAGPRPKYQYTIDTSNKDAILLRYIKVNSKPSDYVSNSRVIATYKLKNAFNNSIAAASRPENVGFRNPDGSVVFYSKTKNTAVYLAFPKEKVQIEIFDPIGGQALSLAILQDQITKVGE